MDIADFIRARLDEDQWRAQAGKDAAEKRTHYRADMLRSCERALRDVDAKRRMIKLAFQHAAKIDGEWGCCHSAEQIEAGLCHEPLPDLLRLLALPYAGHPDYRPEWAPEAED